MRRCRPYRGGEKKRKRREGEADRTASRPFSHFFFLDWRRGGEAETGVLWRKRGN